MHPFPFILLIRTLLGTVLVAGGAGALNQLVERRFDARMRRTTRRPLASGRIEPLRAFWFGILLSSAGAVSLAVGVNLSSGLLATITLLSYLFIYTPLKRITPLCTLAGACSGATPPLIGWVAGSGALNLEAWILCALLFLWQFPHFMAIAWMYREDYARARYRVLPSVGKSCRSMTGLSVLPALALIPLSLIPLFLNHAGPGYMLAALLLDLSFCYCAAQFVLYRTNIVARRLLFASILYLPSLLAVMVISKV
jgi:protoheme IX farnesyltransferase